MPDTVVVNIHKPGKVARSATGCPRAQPMAALNREIIGDGAVTGPPDQVRKETSGARKGGRQRRR